MSKRLVLFLIILWTLLGALAMVWYYSPAAQDTNGITYEEAYAVTEHNVFVSTNVDGNGIIYKLSPGGLLEDYFLGRRNSDYRDMRIDRLAFKDDLYALFEGGFTNAGLNYRGFRVVRFTDSLLPSMDSGWLVLDAGMIPTGMTTDEDRLYITTISSDGKQLAVYEVKYDDLVSLVGKGDSKKSESKNKDDEDEDEEFVELTPVNTEIADTGREFTDACYEPGQLHTRLDNENLEKDKYFETDKSAENAYDRFKVPSKLVHAQNGFYPGLIILIWIIGIPVIVLVCVLLHHRGHFIYASIIMALVIAIVIALSTLATFKARVEITENQYADFASYVTGSVFENIDLNDVADVLGLKERISSDTTAEQIEEKAKAFYDSAYCQLMLSEMETKIRLSDEGEGIMGFALVKRSNGEIILASDNDNRDSVEHRYGKVASDLATTNSGGSHIRIASSGTGFDKTVFLARNLDNDGLYGCSLIAICDYKQDFTVVVKKNKRYINYAVGIFLIATLIVIFILYLQSRDVHLIAKMLKAMAEGKTDIKKPNVRGGDLIAMKNSVYEIEKNIRNVNRAKFMTFEAYYRFAPKSIEKILGKNSIVEVDVGDDTRLMGTVAVVATKGNVVTFPERTNRLYEIFEESRKEHNGIYITCNETLSSSRYLFAEKLQGAVPFGIEVLNGARELSNREYTNTLVLLHYTRFSYGVVGTKEQSVAYLGSTELETLVGYSDWLRSLRLSLVATGSVVEHENCGDTRYIGFIVAGDKVKIDLYEILGGASQRVKEAKKKLSKAFEDALKLFYAQDFFLARNAFTDILRDFPEDELVKWYLFECESRLNGDIEDNFTGALHY